MEKISVRPNILNQLIPMQKELVDQYIQLESLPQYPIDLNSRDGQKVIKTFVGRAVEELAEAYEFLEAVYTMASTNDMKSAQGALQEYNIEMADFWHFLLEILLYSDMGLARITNIVDGAFQTDWERYQGLYKTDNPFKSLLNLAAFINQEQKRKSIENKPDRFTVATDAEMVDNPLLCGGRRISERLLEQHTECLWDITYNLNKLCNYLKNRDWAQTDRVTNILGYNNQVLKVLLSVAIYMDFAGFGEIQIVNNYWYKHCLNLERIKDKY
jgi:hypothetical protein